MKFTVQIFNGKFTFNKPQLITLIKLYELVLEDRNRGEILLYVNKSQWDFYWYCQIEFRFILSQYDIAFTTGTTDIHYIKLNWSSIHEKLEEDKLMLQEEIWKK